MAEALAAKHGREEEDESAKRRRQILWKYSVMLREIPKKLEALIIIIIAFFFEKSKHENLYWLNFCMSGCF